MTPEKKSKGSLTSWQVPVKPGSQSAANWSVGRPAGRQVAATAAQPGSPGILLAGQQAGIWPACPSNGQAGRLPKRGWPARLTALEACQSQGHLGRHYRKACQTPEKNRLRTSPDSGKKYNLAGVPVSHRSQLERRPVLHPALCQEAGKETWANIWPKRLIRHQASDRQASHQGPQAIARQPASHFHNFLDAKPRHNN